MHSLSTPPAPPADFLENHPFDTIRVGDGASLQRQVTQRDIQLFAAVSGDVNPAHVDADYARTDMFHGIIAHGMWGGALISAVLGTELPGPGTIFLNQSLTFDAPVGLGETITVRVEVTHKQEKDRLLLACTCSSTAPQPPPPRRRRTPRARASRRAARRAARGSCWA